MTGTTWEGVFEQGLTDLRAGGGAVRPLVLLGDRGAREAAVDVIERTARFHSPLLLVHSTDDHGIVHEMVRFMGPTTPRVVSLDTVSESLVYRRPAEERDLLIVLDGIRASDLADVATLSLVIHTLSRQKQLHCLFILTAPADFKDVIAGLSRYRVFDFVDLCPVVSVSVSERVTAPGRGSG